MNGMERGSVRPHVLLAFYQVHEIADFAIWYLIRVKETD